MEYTRPFPFFSAKKKKATKKQKRGNKDQPSPEDHPEFLLISHTRLGFFRVDGGYGVG